MTTEAFRYEAVRGKIGSQDHFSMYLLFTVFPLSAFTLV